MVSIKRSLPATGSCDGRVKTYRVGMIIAGRWLENLFAEYINLLSSVVVCSSVSIHYWVIKMAIKIVN